MSTIKRQQREIVDEWVDYLEDQFGIKLFGDKGARWKRWLAEDECMGETVSDGEILEALRFVRRRGTAAPERMTVDKLASWIKWYRKEEAAARRGYNPDSPEGIVFDRKRRMQNANSFIERWSVVCECETVSECDELQDWARKEWPQWDMLLTEEALKARKGAEYVAMYATSQGVLITPQNYDSLLADAREHYRETSKGMSNEV